MADKWVRFKKNLDWFMEATRLNIMSMREYKKAFWFQVFGMMLNNAVFLISWYFVFKLFGDINGWTFKELFGLEGFVGLSYGIIFVFFSGLPNLSSDITKGALDKYLTQPKNVLLNIMVGDSKMSAAGDLLFGVVCIVAYFFIANLPLDRILLVIPLIILVVIIYIGFLLIAQSLTFWIPNGSEIADALHNLMLGPALYPNKAFVGISQFLYKFIVPSILISSFPVDILISPSWETVGLLVLFAGIWLFLGIKVFYWGLKRYESGNLIGKS